MDLEFRVMGFQVERREKDRRRGNCHGSELHGQEKDQITRDSVAGEQVCIALDLPNLGLWLVNKIPGLCVFHTGLSGL